MAVGENPVPHRRRSHKSTDWHGLCTAGPSHARDQDATFGQRGSWGAAAIFSREVQGSALAEFRSRDGREHLEPANNGMDTQRYQECNPLAGSSYPGSRESYCDILQRIRFKMLKKQPKHISVARFNETPEPITFEMPSGLLDDILRLKPNVNHQILRPSPATTRSRNTRGSDNILGHGR